MKMEPPPATMQTIRKPVARVRVHARVKSEQCSNLQIDVSALAEARRYLAGIRYMAAEASVSQDLRVITLALQVLELAPATIKGMQHRVRIRRLVPAA